MSTALLRLRYPATCATCHAELPKGTPARWDRMAKEATCTACLDPEPHAVEIDRGEAGASAAREWQRRHDRREASVRGRFGRLGSVALALSDDPQSTKAWAVGAQGERALGALLDALRDEGMAVLHDRRIPGSRANIDHLVVSPAGVFVIDAKNYQGRVERRDRGGWLSTDDRLYVGGRDRTKLVEGMRKQVEVVREALRAASEGLPIHPVICFVDADWSVFARPIKMGAVQVLWPRALGKLIRADGPLTSEQVSRFEQNLALNLRSTRDAGLARERERKGGR